jgi:predicted RNA-binding Zn-ribbon protein involved in translation (DUF1610 family)
MLRRAVVARRAHNPKVARSNRAGATKALGVVSRLLGARTLGPERDPMHEPIIAATCPDCGEVKLTSGDIDLKLFPNRDPEAIYEFDCPKCSAQVSKVADVRVCRLLMIGGVIPRVIEAPKEVHERQGTEGPPINADDIIDFHFELNEWNGELDVTDPS